MASGPTTDFPIADGVTAPLAPVTPAPGALIPRLEPGDRLTRAEFERRYDAMPELKKAELIEGVVYMPSPVRTQQHGEPDSNLSGVLFLYKSQTPGVISANNATLRIDQDNEPQPDNLLMIESTSGGQATIDVDGYVEGAPELGAEIASSSVSIDVHDKLNVYRRSGVPEYIVWRVLDRAIDWFILRDGRYDALSAGEDRILRSQVFPGLWLNAPAMLDGKLDAVIETLQQGVASQEHTDFVTRLKTVPKK